VERAVFVNREFKVPMKAFSDEKTYFQVLAMGFPGVFAPSPERGCVPYKAGPAAAVSQDWPAGIRLVS